MTPASPTAQSVTSVRLPRSRPANWYSESVSGTGVTAPSMVAGSAPSATAIGNGWPGRARGEVAEIERAAAVGEPAHDHLAPADDLLAVDAQVLAQCATPGPPCGPRVMTRPQVISGPGVLGPAGLDRQAAEVDLVGRRARPRGTAAATPTTGRIVHSVLAICNKRPASRRPFGGSGSLRLASTTPMSRSPLTSVAPIAWATRTVVPKRLARTGIL